MNEEIAAALDTLIAVRAEVGPHKRLGRELDVVIDALDALYGKPDIARFHKILGRLLEDES